MLKIKEHKILNEFKAFITRGNVLDMAIGVVIGGGFSKIVSSLVSDVLLPPMGRLTGEVDFSNLYINLSSTHYATLKDAQAAGAPTINYGLFVTNFFNFLIIAATVFFVVRQMNKLYPRPTETSSGPAKKECPHCLSMIPVKATRCAYCTAEGLT